MLSRLLSSGPTAPPGAGGASVGGASGVAGSTRHVRGTSGSEWSVSSDDLCGVCFDRPNSLHVQGCGHLLCIPCYRRVLRTSGSGQGGGGSSTPSCPFCRGPIEGFAYAGWVQRAAEQHLVAPAGPSCSGSGDGGSSADSSAACVGPC